MHGYDPESLRQEVANVEPHLISLELSRGVWIGHDVVYAARDRFMDGFRSAKSELGSSSIFSRGVDAVLSWIFHLPPAIEVSISQSNSVN